MTGLITRVSFRPVRLAGRDKVHRAASHWGQGFPNGPAEILFLLHVWRRGMRLRRSQAPLTSFQAKSSPAGLKLSSGVNSRDAVDAKRSSAPPARSVFPWGRSRRSDSSQAASPRTRFGPYYR